MTSMEGDVRNNQAKTIAGRRQLWSDLRTKLDTWMLMSHTALLKEAQVGFGNVRIEATREELLTMLIMDYTSKMVGD